MVATALLGASAVALGLAFCRYKARRYDCVAELRQVQDEERQLAPKIVECLSRNFAVLAFGKNHITKEVEQKLDALALSEDDRALVRIALARIGSEWVSDRNPWVLASRHYYQRTRLGHIIGLHREERPVISLDSSAGTVCLIEVEDWGISLDDLRTYVERVDARQLVSAAEIVNRCPAC